MPDRVCGVYSLVNSVTGKCYVGSSIDCAHRFAQHLRALRGKRHINPKLQASFEKHGEVFELQILEAVPDKSALAECEMRWLHLGEYNLAQQAGRPPGHWRPYTDEERATMSRARTGKPQPWMRGRKMSAESNERRAAKLRGVKRDPAIGRKIAQAKIGKSYPRLSAAMRGNTRGAGPWSSERRAKMKAILSDPAVRAKISATHKGRKHSREHTERQCAARRGQKRTFEQRARMRAARMAYLARTVGQKVIHAQAEPVPA